jgi:hypothetical protein
MQRTAFRDANGILACARHALAMRAAKRPQHSVRHACGPALRFLIEQHTSDPGYPASARRKIFVS